MLAGALVTVYSESFTVLEHFLAGSFVSRWRAERGYHGIPTFWCLFAVTAEAFAFNSDSLQLMNLTTVTFYTIVEIFLWEIISNSAGDLVSFYLSFFLDDCYGLQGFMVCIACEAGAGSDLGCLMLVCLLIVFGVIPKRHLFICLLFLLSG